MRTQRDATRPPTPGDPVDQVDARPAESNRVPLSRLGWRGPALGLVAVLVALVALPTLFPSTGALPSPSPIPTVGPSRGRSLTLPATFLPAARGAPAVGRPIRRSANGSEYIDGIPVQFDGEAVLRVRDVLLRPLGNTVLVGGWYVPPVCYGAQPGVSDCASAVLSDVPVDQQGPGWLATDWLAVDSKSPGMGARIMRGKLEPDPACSISLAITCQPRLGGTRIVWVGPPTGG